MIYESKLRYIQPHELGSPQQDSLTNTKLCSRSFLRTARASNCRGCPQFSWKPKARPHISDEQRSRTTSAPMHPRPGRDSPRSLRRLAAGLRGLPRPQPPLPLRSAPLRRPNSPPGPAAKLRSAARRHLPPPCTAPPQPDPQGRPLCSLPVRGAPAASLPAAQVSGAALSHRSLSRRGDFPAGCFPASARLRARIELSSSSCHGQKCRSLGCRAGKVSAKAVPCFAKEGLGLPLREESKALICISF